MQVEAFTMALVDHFLPLVDPQRSGVCIDVGAGTFAFYCERFATMKYPTVVVEPLPSPEFLDLLSRYEMEFFETCISDMDGTQTIYIGTYDNAENVNLSSLVANWWGVSSQSKEVPSMTLQTLLNKINYNEITCLKLDVEGIEYKIIEQLPTVPQLPKVLIFEYGGGGVRSDALGTWDKDSLSQTMKTLDLLRKLDYSYGIVIDSADKTHEKIINLQEITLNPDMIFYPQARYGNMIFFHGDVVGLEQVADIAKKYQNLKAPSKTSWQNLRQFIARLIRK